MKIQKNAFDRKGSGHIKSRNEPINLHPGCNSTRNKPIQIVLKGNKNKPLMLLNQLPCAKANTIRTTLLLNIEAERTKKKISECRINSKTAREIFETYDSFQITIQNPLERGIPTSYNNPLSSDLCFTPKAKGVTELEEKIDFSLFVKKLRKKKTISMGKFRNFVENEVIKGEKKKHHIHNHDSKNELMVQGIQYLRSLTLMMKKEKKIKQKCRFLSQANLITINNTTTSIKTQNKFDDFPVRKNRRRQNSEINLKTPSKTSSESDDDEDDADYPFEYITRNSQEKSSKKLIPKLKTEVKLFSTPKESKFSSFKSVSSHFNNKNNSVGKCSLLKENIIDKDKHPLPHNFKGNIIILNNEDDIELPETQKVHKEIVNQVKSSVEKRVYPTKKSTDKQRRISHLMKQHSYNIIY